MNNFKNSQKNLQPTAKLGSKYLLLLVCLQLPLNVMTFPYLQEQKNTWN